MNKDWSEKYKKMQTLISKEATFAEGIKLLLELRAELFEKISSIVITLPSETYSMMPFGVGEGSHHTTIAWSLWHTFRIEDIVAHELILKDKQIFFEGGWQKKTGSPIITTANELDCDAMIEFSKALSINGVYEYCKAVMKSTNEMLERLKFVDLKRKFTSDDRERLVKSKSVSTSESAVWLIDFWCSKNIKGLIQMPFSRHWIMHVEAMQRIKNKLCKL